MVFLFKIEYFEEVAWVWYILIFGWGEFITFHFLGEEMIPEKYVLYAGRPRREA